MDNQSKLAGLRQDKIIYATEAGAINLLCILIYLVSKDVFSEETHIIVAWILVASASAYMVYMGWGNYRRLREIQSIEGKLAKQKKSNH